MFSTILTRLWTNLGNKTLLNLAELKLYLWEEHLRTRLVQTRLKRSFGTSLEEDLPNQTTSPDAAAAATNAEPTSSADAPTAQDVSTPCDNSAVDSIRQPSMHGIVQELIKAVETDNDKLLEPSTDALSIPIRDLFDFTQSYLVEAYDKLAM